MKKISYWASKNIKTARLLIVIIKIALAALAYYTGLLLTDMQLVLPSVILNLSALVIALGCVVYYPGNNVYLAWLKRHQPSALADNTVCHSGISESDIDCAMDTRKASYRKLQFARRKTCDFLLPLCAVLVIITAVNHGDVANISAVAYGSSIVKGKTAQEILQSGKSRESLTGKEKRVLKREFFKQLKMYATATIKGDEAGRGNALKIILAIVALLGLLYLLTALVCSLSCGGSDVAAVLVGVLGLAGLIWGFIAVLKAIKRKSRVNEEVMMK